MYYYSPSTDAFIYESLIEEYSKAGTLPGDLTEVNDGIYQQFAAENPPEGKRRGSMNGMPAWIDIPPPTKAEFIATAEAEKAFRLEKIVEKTDIWRTQLELGMLKDSDKESLVKWMGYAQTLQDLDLSTAPDIEWPSIPQS